MVDPDFRVTLPPASTVAPLPTTRPYSWPSTVVVNESALAPALKIGSTAMVWSPAAV